MKQYRPDTPEEWARIAGYVRHLGNMLTGSAIITGHPLWGLVSLALTWAGESAADYFGRKPNNQQPPTNN